MNLYKTAIISISCFWVFAIPMAQASDTCLAGKWKVQNETFKMSDQQAGRYDVELSANDGLTIEFTIDSTARLFYDDYIIRHEMVRPNVTVVAEATVNGATQGHFFVQPDKALLHINSVDNVQVETKQKAGASPWMSLEEKERDPMHAEEGFTFSCSGDELVLTKVEHDYFRAEYHGRFVRVD